MLVEMVVRKKFDIRYEEIINDHVTDICIFWQRDMSIFEQSLSFWVVNSNCCRIGFNSQPIAFRACYSPAAGSEIHS